MVKCIFAWFCRLFSKSKKVQATLVLTGNNKFKSEWFTGSLTKEVLNDPILQIQPTYKVWLYSVSTMSFEVEHPIAKGRLIFPPKKVGERYAVVTSLPNIIKWPVFNFDEDIVEFKIESGELIAADIINPTDLDHLSLGRNLADKGVFWSVNNPPTEQEILNAEKQMENYYRNILEKIGALSRVLTPGQLLLEVTLEHHAAAGHFKLTTIWHPVLEQQ